MSVAAALVAALPKAFKRNSEARHLRHPPDVRMQKRFPTSRGYGVRFSMETLKTCALCKQKTELQKSHIVPKFVYRYLKDSSASGYFRSADAPSKRIQDGMVRDLLCRECEARFAGWEGLFAREIFLPTTQSKAPTSRNYDDRLLLFCVSVSWRILVAYRRDGKIDAFPQSVLAEVDEACETWRRVLLGELSNPGRFEQHLLPLGNFYQTSDPTTPANMNRYLTRAVDVVVHTDSRTTFVYVNMCGCLLFGFVEVLQPKQWRGSKVRPRGGVLSQKFEAPGLVLMFLKRRAVSTSETLAKMSSRQREKLHRFMMENPDRVAQSGSFDAISRDVELFGAEAFDR